MLCFILPVFANSITSRNSYNFPTMIHMLDILEELLLPMVFLFDFQIIRLLQGILCDWSGHIDLS